VELYLFSSVDAADPRISANQRRRLSLQGLRPPPLQPIASDISGNFWYIYA
jgi:hypothetical protein